MKKLKTYTETRNKIFYCVCKYALMALATFAVLCIFNAAEANYSYHMQQELYVKESNQCFALARHETDKYREYEDSELRLEIYHNNVYHSCMIEIFGYEKVNK